MATVNAASLRGEFEGAKARVAALRRDGRVSGEVDAVVGVLPALLGLLVAVFLERTTRKTSANSSLPPSQMDGDGTARRTRGGEGAKRTPRTGDGMRRATAGETATVEACGTCGADLPDAGPVARERRVLYDIVFEAGGRRVDAGARECPACRARTRGRFPDGMPGPLQYGPGLQAFTVNLPGAQMLSPDRAVALVHATCGLKLSEATCLGYVRRLHDAPGPREEAAVARLLERPALHADETGLRVDGRTQWLHVLTDGSLTLKRPHRRRGREAIEEIGVIPRYEGVLIHDCWASYLAYDRCAHQLCGAHLLRELAFAVDSNDCRWARLMGTLPRGTCHRVSGSATRTLTEAERRAVRRRYRTILTQGARELPEIPPRPKGRRGRVARSDAHNLHGRPVRHGESVLRFMADPDVSFTDNTGERRIRMAKARIRVSGCFRTQLHAEAWCRIPGHLSSMSALGYNPPSAIQIALAGNAANIIREHDA